MYLVCRLLLEKNFFFNDTATTEIYTLSLHDALPIYRGSKHRRRYELLGGISLLSPEYLLSVERWPFHTEPPDH